MKKLNFLLGAIALMFAMNTAVKAVPQDDSISITIYADCRDFGNITAVPGTADSAANAHNASQFPSYDPYVMYITGSWTPPTAPGLTDWTFFTMDSIAPNIFRTTFKYAPGQFAGNTADDPDLLEDCPAWYFAPTNDWSTNEWVPAPCNVAWDVQRIFYIDIYKSEPDTVVAFKYGVCDPVPLNSLGLPEFSGIDQVNEQNLIVYPNPSDGMIYVDLSSFPSSALIEVFDVSGKVVNKIENASGKVTVNINGMPSSIYLIRISDGISSVSKKIILK
jgi:hypothetical protein